MENRHALLTAVITRVTATMSFLGSSAIIYIILSDRERKLKRPKNRLMLLMSIFDVLQSISLIVSTAALPRDSGIVGAMGSSSTCTAQGFLMVLGMAVPLYNSSLNLFYLLTIRCNMSSDQFSAKIEPMLHIVSILAPSSAAIIFAALGYMQPLGNVCLISKPLPILLFGVMVTFSLLFCIISMFYICRAVRQQALSSARYRFSPVQSNSNPLLEYREMVTQALLYTSAFVITFVFPYIRTFVQLGNQDRTVINLDIPSAIFYPLQGFWNFVFYTRRSVMYVREMNESESLIGAVRETIFNARSLSLQNRRSSLTQMTSRRSSCRRILISPPISNEASPTVPLSELGVNDNKLQIEVDGAIIDNVSGLQPTTKMDDVDRNNGNISCDGP